MLVSDSVIFMTLKNDSLIFDDVWLERLSCSMKAVQAADDGVGGWWVFCGDSEESLQGVVIGVEPEEFLPYLSGWSLELRSSKSIYFTLVYMGTFNVFLKGEVGASAESSVLQDRLRFEFFEEGGSDYDADGWWRREFFQRQVDIWRPWHAGWYQMRWVSECIGPDIDKKLPLAGFLTFVDHVPSAAATLSEAVVYGGGMIITTPGDPEVLTFEDVTAYTQRLQEVGFSGPEHVW